MVERYLKFNCECGADLAIEPTGSDAHAVVACSTCQRRISIALKIEPVSAWSISGISFADDLGTYTLTPLGERVKIQAARMRLVQREPDTSWPASPSNKGQTE